MQRELRPVFLALFFASGAAGLVYEIAWSRLLVFVFGGTTLAVATVLTCFMAGLALGSRAGGRLAHRLASPERAYGFLEIALGAAAALTPALFPLATPIYRALARVAGDAPALLTAARFVVCAAILVVPTTCMGATLPLLAEAFARRGGAAGRSVGRLYGVNTAGAFAGCAAAGFWLLPAAGIRASIWLAAAVNVAAGLTALTLSAPPSGARPAAGPAPEEPAGPAAPLPRGAVLWLYGASGAAAMALQVAWTRGLTLSLGSTTYAASTVVACVILGLAAGSLAASRRVDAWQNPLAAGGALEAATALSALVVCPLLGELPGLVSWLARNAGLSFGALLAAEAACVLGLLLVPTLCLGALFPVMCRLCDPGRRAAGRSTGDVYAANTAGTIVGAAAAGFLLIPSPAVGVQGTILLAAAVNGLVATALLLAERRGSRPRLLGLLSAAWLLGGAAAAAAGPWSRELMISGPYLGRARSPQRLLFYREGPDATVAVTESDGAGLSLRVNGKPDASTGWPDMVTQQLSGHIPLLLRPGARDVCVIGLGSGTTAGAVLAHPVSTVDVAEISPAVAEAARHFAGVNNGALTDPRVRLHEADGRNFLLLGEKRYDVVISEPSNPWMSGVAGLFTREFFALVRSRLKPGGLHCQWIQGYRIDPDDFGAVLRTLADVFPYTQVWSTGLSDFLVVGSDRPLPVDPEGHHLAFGRPGVRRMLGSLLLNDPAQLANHYVADGEHLRPWTDDQRLLTDDRPDLEYSTSRKLLDGSGEAPLRRLLYGLGGRPALKGGRQSPLNRRLLQAVAQNRRRELYLAEALSCRDRGDRFNVFPNLVRAARCSATDPRGLILVALELRSLRGDAGDPAARSWADATLRRLDTEVPNFAACRKFMETGARRFSWPLSPHAPRPVRPELRSLCARLMSLAADGSRESVLAAAREVARLAPDEPAAWQVAGRVVLDVCGPAEARPFLLRAWSLDSRDPATCYALARAYCLEADRGNALAFLEAAVAAGFRDAELLRSDAYFAALGRDRAFRRLLGRLTAG